MGFLKPPKIDAPAPPPAAAAPPVFASGKPQGKKSTVPTSFMGEGKVPDTSTVGGLERGKTLLGQ
jgi:hypothetical protein